jgi:leucine dehydrogenase
MNEPVMDYMRRYRFKKLLLLDDADTGLRAVIAIHSTALGPAGGGVRFWPYPSEKEAIIDAMRLARGMTYKYAAAGIDLGGGKAVIVGDPRKDKSEALLRAFGRMVDQLGGEYYLAEDVGTTSEDAETIYKETGYVLSLPEHLGGPGDVAPLTALGSIEATRACAKRVWGTPDLAGRSVALQGLGAVGYKALRLLVESGARVVVADVDEAKVRQAQQEFGVEAVPAEDIYDQDVDIFGPYALGAVINDQTIPRIKARIVAGSANNVLAEERHGTQLEEHGICYAVDFVANSGGIVYDEEMVCPGLRKPQGGLRHDRAEKKVREIFGRIEEVFVIADCEGVPCWQAAIAWLLTARTTIVIVPSCVAYGPEKAQASPSANAWAVEPSSSPWSGLNSVTVTAASFSLPSRTPSALIAVSNGRPSLRPGFSESGRSVKSTVSTSKWTSKRSKLGSISPSARAAAPSGSAATSPTGKPFSSRRSIMPRSHSVACSGPWENRNTSAFPSSGERWPIRPSSGAVPSSPSMCATPIQSRAPSVTLPGTLRSG